MAVRYDPKLLDEIRRTVKNYQAKRQRVLSKGGEIIPEPASVPHYLNDYTDRRALLRDLKKLQRYSVRGAESIVTLESGERITQYDLGEYRRMATQGKRNITLQLKRADNLDTMQPLTKSYFQNLQARYEYLSKPISSLSSRQLKTFIKIAQGESDLDLKRHTFQQNMRVIVDEITYGLPSDTINDFKAALSRFSTDKLSELFNSDPVVKSISDYYFVVTSGGKLDKITITDSDGTTHEVTYEDRIKAITEYLNAL